MESPKILLRYLGLEIKTKAERRDFSADEMSSFENIEWENSWFLVDVEVQAERNDQKLLEFAVIASLKLRKSLARSDEKGRELQS